MGNLTSAPPYLGDYKEDEIVTFLWDSVDRNGASITRSTNGTIEVYRDGNITQSIAGVQDTEGFDGATGRHLCVINLAADGFYAPVADFTVVLTGAVIDTRTVNVTIAHFSIENRAPIMAIGAPVALDSGDATLSGNLTKLADDNGGADFDATTDSQEKIAVGLNMVTGAFVIRSNTAQDGGTATITLDAGASAVDNFYRHTQITITGGTGAGQAVIIVKYDGGTKVATVAHDWHTQPVNGSTFAIVPGQVHAETSHVELQRGIAQAGAAGTVTLGADASAVDDFYKNQMVVLDDGTGGGQTRLIDSYVGSSRVATIKPAWKTNPDSSTEYAIYPAIADIITGLVDTVTIETILSELMSRTNGDYDVDSPGTGDITFKKRGGSESHVVNVTAAGRTRTSP